MPWDGHVSCIFTVHPWTDSLADTSYLDLLPIFSLESVGVGVHTVFFSLVWDVTGLQLTFNSNPRINTRQSKDLMGKFIPFNNGYFFGFVHKIR